MNTILKMLNDNHWDEALKGFTAFTNNHELDEQACIIGATIMEHYGDMILCLNSSEEA